MDGVRNGCAGNRIGSVMSFVNTRNGNTSGVRTSADSGESVADGETVNWIRRKEAVSVGIKLTKCICRANPCAKDHERT